MPQYLESVHSRLPGKLIYRSITLTGTGALTFDAFQLIGSVWLRKLYGVVVSAATLTNCTATSFALNAAGGTVQLTKNDGALSGVAVGTAFAKLGLAGATMVVGDTVVPAVMEPAAAGVSFSECLISAQNGNATVLRLLLATTDNPIAATCTIFAEWAPASASGVLTTTLPT